MAYTAFAGKYFKIKISHAILEKPAF